jgi:hypothetical protein
MSEENSGDKSAQFVIPPQFTVDEKTLTKLYENEKWGFYSQFKNDDAGDEVFAMGGLQEASKLGVFRVANIYLKNKTTNVILPISYLQFEDVFKPQETGVPIQLFLVICIARIRAIEKVFHASNMESIGVTQSLELAIKHIKEASSKFDNYLQTVDKSSYG